MPPPIKCLASPSLPYLTIQKGRIGQAVESAQGAVRQEGLGLRERGRHPYSGSPLALPYGCVLVRGSAVGGQAGVAGTGKKVSKFINKYICLLPVFYYGQACYCVSADRFGSATLSTIPALL